MLRAIYALLAFGMGVQVWPEIIQHGGNWDEQAGITKCMLGSMSALALLGIRYPIKMLPLLFWELLWKTIWLVAVAWPLWSTGTMDADTAETAFAVAMVVLVYVAIPWGYVFGAYVRQTGDPWVKRRAATR
jgi:hypothetical protein